MSKKDTMGFKEYLVRLDQAIGIMLKVAKNNEEIAIWRKATEGLGEYLEEEPNIIVSRMRQQWNMPNQTNTPKSPHYLYEDLLKDGTFEQMGLQIINVLNDMINRASEWELGKRQVAKYVEFGNIILREIKKMNGDGTAKQHCDMFNLREETRWCF